MKVEVCPGSEKIRGRRLRISSELAVLLCRSCSCFFSDITGTYSHQVAFRGVLCQSTAFTQLLDPLFSIIRAISALLLILNVKYLLGVAQNGIGKKATIPGRQSK